VSGLPYETTEEQLKEFFGDDAKEIGGIKLPKYQDSSRCIGYAHVLFNTLNAYESALSKNGSKIGSRYLDIKAAEGQKVLSTSQVGKWCSSLRIIHFS
jgi:RNA recognition motif-containing protein